MHQKKELSKGLAGGARKYVKDFLKDSLKFVASFPFRGTHLSLFKSKWRRDWNDSENVMSHVRIMQKPNRAHFGLISLLRMMKMVVAVLNLNGPSKKKQVL